MFKANPFVSDYGTVSYTTEEGTRNALIQFTIYLIHLICVTVAGNSLTTPHQHEFTKSLRQSFEVTNYMPNNSVLSLTNVMTISDFWNYMEYVVLPLLHGVVYDETVRWDPSWVDFPPNLFGRLHLNESLMLGAPRLRQVRVKKDSCFVQSDFTRYTNTCYAEYSVDAEYTKPTYKGTKYSTMAELKATPIRGLINTYKSGGYVQMLSYKKDVNFGIVRHLRQIDWLDEASRMVVLEFNMINLNMDLEIVVKIVFEILPTGLVHPVYKSHCHYADLLPPSSSWFILTCAVVVYSINFYFTFIELKKIYLYGFKNYFTRLPIFLTLPVISITYVSLGYSIYMLVFYAGKSYKIFNNAGNDFVPLDYVSLSTVVHCDLIAFLLFFSWMTLLRFMDFNPVLRTLGIAMKIASGDLGAFAIMFLIAFVAYGNLGLLLFGGVNENFKDFQTAFLTMVCMLVSDFDYFKLEHESSILGPIFFLTYILLIFFVLMNMSLASIVLSYRTATATVAFKPSFLSFYVRKQLYRLTCGLFKAPEYPKWYQEYYGTNHALDEKKIEELNLRKEYTEIEAEVDILMTRLGLMRDILFRLTNNIGDLVTHANNEYKQGKKKRL